MKICFAASSGGHLEQIMKLEKLMKKNDGFLVTEKTLYKVKTNYPTYYLEQVNRDYKYIYKFIKNIFLSLRIIMKEKPDMIISTGALSTVPIIVLGKIMKKKIVFIESFAKIKSPSLTGKLAYRLANLFIIQWEDLRKYYPNAVYGGGIY